MRRKNRNDRYEEICVYCRLGSMKFMVSLPSDEFTVAGLKSEIGRRLLCEFGATREVVGGPKDSNRRCHQGIRSARERQSKVLGLVLE